MVFVSFAEDGANTGLLRRAEILPRVSTLGMPHALPRPNDTGGNAGDETAVPDMGREPRRSRTGSGGSNNVECGLRVAVDDEGGIADGMNDNAADGIEEIEARRVRVGTCRTNAAKLSSESRMVVAAGWRVWPTGMLARRAFTGSTRRSELLVLVPPIVGGKEVDPTTVPLLLSARSDDHDIDNDIDKSGEESP